MLAPLPPLAILSLVGTNKMTNEMTDLQVANVKLGAAEKAVGQGIITWAEYLEVVKDFHRVCDEQR